MNAETERTLDKIWYSLKSKSPVIFAIAGVVGVGGTAIVTYICTKRACKKLKENDIQVKSFKDELKITWREYLPAVGVSMATIGFIFSSAVISAKQRKSLTAAVAAITALEVKYKDKIKELGGKEFYDKLKEELYSEEIKPEEAEKPASIKTECLKDIQEELHGSQDSEVLRTFYDTMTERYFSTTFANVLTAEAFVNKRLINDGYAHIYDFVNSIGMNTHFDIPNDVMEKGWIVGDDSIVISSKSDDLWIDFDHTVVTLEDGLQVITIEPRIKPHLYFEDDVCYNLAKQKGDEK